MIDSHKKVAITGASGFIGSRLTRHLALRDFRVVAVMRDSNASSFGDEANVTVVEGDVTDAASLATVFEDCDVVVNLAALFNHPDRSLEDYERVNVGGVRNVLEVAQRVGVEHVVHCSTVGVAAGGQTPFSEASAYCPPDWDKYETTKCAGEQLALQFAEANNYKVSVVRPAQVYGPGDTSKVKFYKMVRNGVIVSPGSTLKHLIYVDDLCAAFECVIRTMATTGRPVIIAGNEITPLSELVEIVARELGVETPKIRLPASLMTLIATIVETTFNLFKLKPPIFRRSMDFFTKSVAFDTSVMANELGFTPATAVPDGVKATAQWYKEHDLL